MPLLEIITVSTRGMERDRRPRSFAKSFGPGGESAPDEAQSRVARTMLRRTAALG
jgi:hypothetical protein